MSARALLVEECLRPEDIAVVAQGMRAYALCQINGEESAPLACFVRENGSVVGGIVGRIIKHRRFVDLLWVEEARRHSGLGSSLIRAIERAASEKGCRDVLLETLSSSAERLYAGLGYRLVAEIPDYISQFAKRVFIKSLA